MKKILLIAALIGTCGLVRATTINAPSSLIGTNALDGNSAYAWGIKIAVPTGQQVTTAEIDFTSINLTVGNSSGTGYLYTDLLNTKSGTGTTSGTTGLTTATDNDGSGDYWATKFSGANITSIGTAFFKSVGTTLTWAYKFDANGLAALNSYLNLNGGYFSIGLDPDCHYSVGGLSFNYTTGSKPNTSVPDDALTAFLVVISLGCLEIFRRRLVPAVSKA